LVKSSTEQAPIMIIADEAYWGTEKGGRFAKLIIKNLKENPNSIVIGVSATQYEQDYSTENVFHKVYMKLSDGYVGPSKISGVKLPHEPDYQEKDVTIEESIPLNLKYYTGRTTDKSKVKVLLDFLLEKKYFSECNVSKWIDIDSAEHAASYLESKKFNVIRHFGKHLKEPLLKKLPSNGKYSLVVVDALQCSTTLPKDIVIGIDLTSFTLEDEVPNLTKLQELYGRFCGYGKNGMKLISCPGLKSYVEAYKDGPITIQPHLRVTKPISGSRILYFSEKFKSENEAWVAKQESEIQIESDELFSKLQACAVKYKKDAYKNQKGNKETIDILNQISNSDIKQFYYRGIEMPPNDSLARTWSAAQCQSGILWDKIKKVAWGFYRYEQSDNKNGQWNTNNKSLYAGKM